MSKPVLKQVVIGDVHFLIKKYPDGVEEVFIYKDGKLKKFMEWDKIHV